MFSEDLDEIKKRQLCLNCVGENFLQEIVRTAGKRRKCFYCNDVDRAHSIEVIAAEVERAFEDHFERTASEPDGFEYAMHKDEESNYEWSREGQGTVYAIMDAALIPEEAARDIQQVLEDKYGDFDSAAMGDETEFDSEAHYAEKNSSDEVWQV